MKIQITIIFFSLLFVASCGGGGGGGSGGSSASPVQSYSYDKTTTDYTNKTWQVDSAARTIRDTQSEWSWDNFASWYPSWSENGIDIDFVENSDYLSINIGYQSTNYSIQLSELDSNIEPLYDPSGNLIAAIAQNNYTDATLRSFFFFPDYMSGLNIEYTNVGFLDLFLGGQDRDTFALNYGSKTFSGDMPSSGSATYGIFGEGILTQYFSSSSSNIFVTRGDGSLTANFNSNKISGTLSFKSFYGYNEFLQYGATSDSQVLNAPVFTVNFTEKTYNENGQTWSLGSISGNSFDNYITLSSEGTGHVGDGVAGGSFFGPDGKEISGTFLIVSDEDNDQTGLFDWDLVGVLYGTCKQSNC